MPHDEVTPDWARPVVHWEIQAIDADRQRAFYSEVFNWSIGEGPIMGIPAGLGAPEGGPAGHIRQADRAGVSLYVQVRSLTESIDRITARGGSVVIPPFDLAGGPSLAMVLDPEGNGLTLVQQ